MKFETEIDETCLEIKTKYQKVWIFESHTVIFDIDGNEIAHVHSTVNHVSVRESAIVKGMKKP